VTASRTCDSLIVGSGLFRAVFVQQAPEHGRSVLVLGRRNHLGGHGHSCVDAISGASVHVYGTYVFVASTLAQAACALGQPKEAAL
jgi:UDP-galactopyranose mutase